jgi:peptidoglycan/LPS O-acetylase OafA/YrhL
MRTESASGNFVVLDRLRGVAALLVLVDHAGCILLGRDLVPRNLLAVQFFFMLSGFVVACGYEARMQAGMSAHHFLLRRAIRLYPLIFLGVAVGTGALLVTNPAFARSPDAFLTVLLAFVCWPAPEAGFSFGRFPVNPPEWSLFFELAANLGFATVLPWLRRRAVTLLAIGASVLYAALTIKYWPGSMPFWCEGIGAAGAFSTGIALWRRHQDVAFLYQAPRPVLAWPVLALVFTAVCMAPLPLGPFVSPLAGLALFPAIILAGAAHGRSKGKPDLLGALSYPIYILHWPVVLLVREWLAPIIAPTLAVPAACAIACCCAWAALSKYDLPLRARLQTRAGVPVSSTRVAAQAI